MHHIAPDVQALATAAVKTPPQPNRPNGRDGSHHDLWRGFNPYCPALEHAKRAVADWYTDGLDRGQALVLSGPPGTGKTHLALVVLAAYGAPHQAWMISEADMVANLRSSYQGGGRSTEQMIIAQYRRAPLLILDDVGVAYVKSDSQGWIEDIYWRIFDRRAELRLGTLITTNLSFADLPGRLGSRAFSRLCGAMGGTKELIKENLVSLAGVEDYRRRR